MHAGSAKILSTAALLHTYTLSSKDAHACVSALTHTHTCSLLLAYLPLALANEHELCVLSANHQLLCVAV